jgi:hypothetical protein
MTCRRWCASNHSSTSSHHEVTSPEQWTRELAADFVAAVDRMNIGDYMHPLTHYVPTQKIGEPLRNNSKVAIVNAARVFFRAGHEWGRFPRKFDPIRASPSSGSRRENPSPRLITDDVWAKLLWAGLNLTAEDMPVCTYRAGDSTMPKGVPWYPPWLYICVPLGHQAEFNPIALEPGKGVKKKVATAAVHRDQQSMGKPRSQSCRCDLNAIRRICASANHCDHLGMIVWTA